MKILIFGNGMVGNELAKRLDSRHDTAIFKDHILFRHDIETILDSEQPDVVINAIGKTGKPNVDWCESHKDETYFANTEVPRLLALATEKFGIRLVQISSGCIYAGDGDGNGFKETDEPNFFGSFYSFTKYAAERLISYKPHVLTVRLRIPLIAGTSDRGILSKLMKYDTIIETPNSISYLPDFIDSVIRLIESGTGNGIWNLTNPEPITHKRILEIFDEVNGTDVVGSKTFIEPKELVVTAPRSNCVLSSNKINREFPGSMRNTEEAVYLAVKNYGA